MEYKNEIKATYKSLFCKVEFPVPKAKSVAALIAPLYFAGYEIENNH